MKTLSVMQPWAWLMANDYKDIENRGWKTSYRGYILIHAGQRFDREGYDWVKAQFPEIPLPAPEALERGGIVGKVALVDCLGTDVMVLSPWYQGAKYAWKVLGGQPLPFQPCKGKLSLFETEYKLGVVDAN